MTPPDGRNDGGSGRDPREDDASLAELARALDALADDERASLEEARSAADEEDVGRVLRAFDEAAGAAAGEPRAHEDTAAPGAPAELPPAPRLPERWPLILVAAAALLATVLLTWDDEPAGPGPGGEVLGGRTARVVRPPEELAGPEDLTVVQWDFPGAAPTWTYEVRIIDAGDDELARSDRLDSTTWLVPPGARSDAGSWPDTVIVVVEAFEGATGARRDSARREVSFSSR